MCGIIGVLCKCAKAEDILIEGVQLLQNRGYDSAGISSIQKGKTEFTTTKLASQESQKIDCIEYLVKNAPQLHSESVSGIAHTRWATCGGKTDENSHPHLDYSNSISLVHNGTISNYDELKKELEEVHKIQLRSETDSELVSQIVSVYMHKDNLSLKEAISSVIEDAKIDGQWALCAIHKDHPELMVVAKRGSPILIGFSTDKIIVASEKIVFQNHTDQFIDLDENEIIELNINNSSEKYISDKKRIQTNVDKIKVQVKPNDGYESFFEQEIDEQQDSILETMGKGARLRGKADACKLGGLEQYVDQITALDNIIIVACGSSYQASCYAATYLKKLQCLNTVQCIEGSEFCEYDLPQGKSGIVLVSQSGETADLRHALETAKQINMFSIGIINAVGSQIARGVDCGIYLNCGREVAVAATKSFTSQVCALIMLSIWISDKKDQEKKKFAERKRLVRALQQLPITIGGSLADIAPKAKETAQFLAKQSTIICLGKGPCAAIAKEGALKIKELTYIHAEAFSAGELKHGPLALINPEEPKSTCVILIILDGEHLDDMKLCLSEVHSRQAQTLIITDCEEKINKDQSDHIFEIQNSGELTSLLCVLAFQKITAEICKVNNLNPDKPRNLAKCVTTK